MKKIAFILTFCSLCLSFSAVNAQQVFRAGIVGGVNFTQIDGDDLIGYNKIGVTGGFMVEIGLDEYERWSAVMEILYTQKGSRSTIRDNAIDLTITMDYAEIPLYVKYHDLRGGLSFGLGPLIARSVRNKFVIAGVDNTVSHFGGEFPAKKWELGALVDVSYMFSNFGLGFRFTNSITGVRTNCNSIIAPTQCLRQRHRTLALRGIFLLGE